MDDINNFQTGVYQAQCGKPFKSICGFDVNSLYAFALMKHQPCGPGVLFKRVRKNSNIFKGQCMLNKSDGWSKMSYSGEEWLQYEARKSDFVNATDPGKYYPMQTYLTGGEKRFFHDGKIFALDGFIQTPTHSFAFSYKGCYFHYCPHCQTNLDKQKDENERDR